MAESARTAPQTCFSDSTKAQILLGLTPGVGPLSRQRLIARFGDAESIFAASERSLQQVQGIGPKTAKQIVSAPRDIELDAQLALIREHGLSVLLPNESAFPRLLSEIHDPPGVIFSRGDLEASDQLSVAIVGTRRPTSYGRAQAARLAGGLARLGFSVISGMARGIDAAAHRGALDAGGRTIAVLASGVLNPYPPEHVALADEIAQQGCVLSEAAPTMPPMSGMFPQRNRIISGLSLGTIVVEAAHRSGALITARHAMEQGREVFAVPGQIDNPLAVGPNRLIRDGARIVTCIEDVLEELGPLAEPVERASGQGDIRDVAELKLNELETQILQSVQPGGSTIDDMAARCQLPVHRVMATVSVLETRKLLHKTGGNRVVRS